MKFYTVDEMKTIPEEILGSLGSVGEAVIISNNKPTAVMMEVTNDNFDDIIKAMQQAKIMATINSMRERSEINGVMSPEEIDAEIAAARRGE